MREGSAIGSISIRRTEVSPFSDKQIALLKHSPTRLLSQLRTCGCSKNCRIATPNCAKPWSIRPLLPRCSASSAVRRRTCSLSSTPSSKARRGFVGLMIERCDSAKETLQLLHAHFGSIPIARREISIGQPQHRWSASTARSTFPTPARRTTSRT